MNIFYREKYDNNCLINQEDFVEHLSMTSNPLNYCLYTYTILRMHSAHH